MTKGRERYISALLTCAARSAALSICPLVPPTGPSVLSTPSRSISFLCIAACGGQSTLRRGGRTKRSRRPILPPARVSAVPYPAYCVAVAVPAPMWCMRLHLMVNLAAVPLRRLCRTEDPRRCCPVYRSIRRSACTDFPSSQATAAAGARLWT